ncbi:MAG TPA: FAD-dependent oxidoreductase [Burkholderiaceae bacterium]|nr:FAD-dependent oxidoreductase [Burkholderiaceae bacterium]
MKRLVLLGGGHAHVHVLAELAREPMPGVQAVLATPYARQIYSGMVPGWMAGHYTLDQCSIALEPLARAAKVELALAPAVSMNANERTVTLADGRVAEYDVLSIDTGSQFDRDAIEGAREHGLFLRPIEHFVQLYERVLGLATDRLLNLVVIGGGAAGFEVALAVNHRFNGAGQERARVCLVTGAGTVLPGFSPAVRERALGVLRRARVTLLNQRCIEVSSGQVQLDNGARLVCDVPLLALPTVAPGWLHGSALALDAHGFISTTPTLQSASHAEVFAAGDVASRNDRELPRSGVFAVRAGPALALNLRRHLAGGPLQPWQPKERSLYLLSCGARRAIASWGQFSAQGRWVWAWKDWIDRRFVARYAEPAPAAEAALPISAERGRDAAP